MFSGSRRAQVPAENLSWFFHRRLSYQSIHYRCELRLDSRAFAWYGILMSTQYVTDDTGRKTAVLLPIERYERLLEDLEDLAAIAERRDEPTISHEELVEELKRDGLLPA